MQAANISAVLLAFALWAAPDLAPAAFAAAGAERAVAADERREAAVPYVAAQTGIERPPLSERAREYLHTSYVWARDLLEAGYQRAPILVIVLSALLLLPVVALVSFILQRTARRRSERAAIDALARKAQSAHWPGDMPVSRSIPVRQYEAWLVVGEAGGEIMPLASQMTRIGRHPDNDVRLPDSSVHRYHAVIERTADAEFVITDMSGREGNGVRVNGERLQRAHLVDGDVIELGRAQLKFASVLT